MQSGTRGFIFGLLMLLFAATATANYDSTRLEKKYEDMGSMQADFTQTLIHKESGARENRSGVIFFKKPLLVRWETKSPQPELLIVAKDSIWNAFPEEEIAYKYAVDIAQDSSSIIRVITGQARLAQDFFVEYESMDKGTAVLRLYPKEPTQSMVEAKIWIEMKTDLIKKLLIVDFYGNENEITFTRQKTGVKLQDSLFTYKAPADFIVEDRTKDTAAKPGKL